MTTGVEVEKDVEVGCSEDAGEDVRVSLSSVEDSESDNELDSEPEEVDSVSDELLLESVEVDVEDSSCPVSPDEVEVTSGNAVLSVDVGNTEEVNSSRDTEEDSVTVVDVDESLSCELDVKSSSPSSCRTPKCLRGRDLE